MEARIADRPKPWMTLTFDKRDADRPALTAEQVREVRVALLAQNQVDLDEDDLQWMCRATGLRWAGYTPEERAAAYERYRAHCEAVLTL